MVHNRIGPPVIGGDFFDREVEQRQIWDAVEGSHLLLLAPRRVGKTSLMWRLRDTAAEHGFAAAYCSVAEAQDEAAFADKLSATVAEFVPSDRTLRKVLTSGPGRLFRRVKKVEVAGSSVDLDGSVDALWTSRSEGLVLALERGAGRWLLLVDELPVFVLNLVRTDPSGERARRFLTWFRSLRQRSDGTDRRRWLLAGSIGLDTVTARLSLGDTINDLRLVSLGAFAPEVADRLLVELGETHRFPLSEEVRQRLVERVGWPIPYHLQILFATLREHCGDGAREASWPDVDTAFEALFSPAKKAYFDFWRQRLAQELGTPDGGYAETILNAAAVDPEGASREVLLQTLRGLVASDGAERLRYLLEVLESDGYLVEVQGRHCFRSPLLREYWLRRVVP